MIDPMVMEKAVAALLGRPPLSIAEREATEARVMIKAALSDRPFDVPTGDRAASLLLGTIGGGTTAASIEEGIEVGFARASETLRRASRQATA